MTAATAELQVEFEAARQATWFRCLHQDPPWKVVRGFRLESGGTLVHLHNVSGGIFGGDRLQMTATLHAGAEAQVTTTGATRLYRPRAGANEAVLKTCFHLAPGALLEYLPDPVIPFQGSRVLQHTSYALAEDATLFSWETLAPGRAAGGERFQYERLKIINEVTVMGKPCLVDRMLLEPSRWPIDTPARFGSNAYLVTFLAIHAGLSTLAMKELEQALLHALPPVAEEKLRQNYWGVTALQAHGVMVRGAIHAPSDIPAILLALWSAAKWQLCQQAVQAPRKTY